ncbi:hypothetical protein [Marinitoga litoralis]|uniref:hypothetical protein n=1 Tax=Marinitoga litoralis TaxID=570855 RepID=UPI0019607676|nr:hypothetical protein [Marinitoga litoralis]MBM7559317.1 hypothetical protein [Marinitoga litoralis]
MKKKILTLIFSIVIIYYLYANDNMKFFRIEEKYDNSIMNYTFYPDLGLITNSSLDFQHKNIYLFFKKKKVILKINFDNSTEKVNAFNLFNKEDIEINNIIPIKDDIIVFSKKNKKLYVFSNLGKLKYTINNEDLLDNVKYILPYKNESLILINDIGELHLINVKGIVLNSVDIIKKLKIDMFSIEKYKINNENFYYLSNENKIYQYNIKTGEIKKILEWFPNKIIDFSVGLNGNIFFLYRDNNTVKGSYLFSQSSLVKVFCKIPLDIIFEGNIKISNIDNYILIIGDKGYKVYNIDKIINE